MIDRPSKHGKATEAVRAPQRDDAMRTAVDQLHEIARASASQKESDAKILAAALSSAYTLRDVSQQKTTKWQRAVWACACCGILSSGGIGLISWQNIRQANLHQVRLRQEIVKRDDEINSLRSRTRIPSGETSQLVGNADSTSEIESIISGYALESNLRFDTLASSAETLAQKVTDLAHKQNGLLLAMTQMLYKLESKFDAPIRSEPRRLPQSVISSVSKTPASVIDTTQDRKAPPPSVRLLHSRPIDKDRLTAFTDVQASRAWHFPEGFQNPSGHCIPTKPSNR